MRRKTKQSGLQMIECLEGRMLLSVWEGNWTVQLQEVNAESGHATIAPLSKPATIAPIAGAPGQFRLSVPSGNFSVDPHRR